MSEVHSGKTISEAHKRALREANTGRTHTEETRRKLSDKLRGKKKPPRSIETRRKMSESAKKRHARAREARNVGS